MANRNYVCVTIYDFDMGGTPTYWFRMLTWAKGNGYAPYLMVHKRRSISKRWEQRLKEENIEIVRFDLKYGGICFDSNLQIAAKFITEETLFVTAELHCYINLKQYSINAKFAKCILYILHPLATQICGWRIVNNIYKRVLKADCNEGVIFMDEETFYSYKKYYGDEIYNEHYFRLGNYVSPIDYKSLHKRNVSRHDKFKILTVSRFEFPFKGYLLGMLNSLKNVSFPNDYELIIVGNGPNYDDFVDAMNVLEDDIVRHIKLVGEVDYTLLGKYYSEASAYVGMGTTLLEASQNGVPSIVASAFQIGEKSTGFLFDSRYNLGGNSNIESSSVTTISECLQKVVKSSYQEYQEMAESCYEVNFVDYNLDDVMEKVLKVHTNTTKHRVLCVINTLIVKAKIYVQEQRKIGN